MLYILQALRIYSHLYIYIYIYMYVCIYVYTVHNIRDHYPSTSSAAVTSYELPLQYNK